MGREEKQHPKLIPFLKEIPGTAPGVSVTFGT
jgi:hypothetical protein